MAISALVGYLSGNFAKLEDGSWSDFGSDAPDGRTITSIHGLAEDDFWEGGDELAGAVPQASHWDGSVWDTITLGDRAARGFCYVHQLATDLAYFMQTNNADANLGLWSYDGVAVTEHIDPALGSIRMSAGQCGFLVVSATEIYLFGRAFPDWTERGIYLWNGVTTTMIGVGKGININDNIIDMARLSDGTLLVARKDGNAGATAGKLEILTGDFTSGFSVEQSWTGTTRYSSNRPWFDHCMVTDGGMNMYILFTAGSRAGEVAKRDSVGAYTYDSGALDLGTLANFRDLAVVNGGVNNLKVSAATRNVPSYIGAYADPTTGTWDEIDAPEPALANGIAAWVVPASSPSSDPTVDDSTVTPTPDTTVEEPPCEIVATFTIDDETDSTKVNVTVDGEDAIIAGVFQDGYNGPQSSITSNNGGLDVVIDKENCYSPGSHTFVVSVPSGTQISTWTWDVSSGGLQRTVPEIIPQFQGGGSAAPDNAEKPMVDRTFSWKRDGE